MKVKHYSPNFFVEENRWINIHNPISYIGRLVRAPRPVDRTDKFNLLNMTYSPIPIVGNWNKSFGECCMSRAKEFWKKGKPITLFWSGGIDSSVALISLLETKHNTDILNIRYTQNSIEEFPEMWKRLVKDKNNPIHDKDVIDKKLFEDHDIIKITGECGDQCFGSDALLDKWDYINKDWETIFTFGYDNMTIVEVLFETVELAPFEIKTIFDLYWWINFCFKWEDVNSRMLFIYAQTPHWQSTFSFFNTEDFQKWSINNHDIKHQGTVKTYKQPAKEFINKYLKDENYRKNKTKELSLIKVLEGSVDGEYTKEIMKERNQSPNSLKLVLDNGKYWKRNEFISKEILNKIIKEKNNGLETNS